MNTVILSGNLAQDPFVRGSSNVTVITIATNKEWTDRQSGERQRRTDFIPVTLFGTNATFAAKYLKKGRHVEVTAEVAINKWEDKTSGKTRYDTEIHALTIKPTGPKPKTDNDGEGDNAMPSYEGFDEAFDGDFSKD